MIDRKVVSEDRNTATAAAVAIELLEITLLPLPIVSQIDLFQSFRRAVKCFYWLWDWMANWTISVTNVVRYASIFYTVTVCVCVASWNRQAGGRCGLEKREVTQTKIRHIVCVCLKYSATSYSHCVLCTYTAKKSRRSDHLNKNSSKMGQHGNTATATQHTVLRKITYPVTEMLTIPYCYIWNFLLPPARSNWGCGIFKHWSFWVS